MAGLKIFAEKGYNGSTFRDICEAAGSNIASINYYFSDKTGFYFAVRDYALDKMRDRMKQCWDMIDIDPWKALRIHIELLLDMSYDDVLFHVSWFHLRELIDVNNVPRAKLTPEVKESCRTYEERMAKMMSGLLGDVATPQNRNLLKYTYHSLCQFLPIHKLLETRIHKGGGVFNVATIDRNEMEDFIFDAVKRTVESMKAKHASSQQSDNQ